MQYLPNGLDSRSAQHISPVHQPKSFINAGNHELQVLRRRTIIHDVFLLSALAIATTARRLASPVHEA